MWDLNFNYFWVVLKIWKQLDFFHFTFLTLWWPLVTKVLVTYMVTSGWRSPEVTRKKNMPGGGKRGHIEDTSARPKKKKYFLLETLLENIFFPTWELLGKIFFLLKIYYRVFIFSPGNLWRNIFPSKNILETIYIFTWEFVGKFPSKFVLENIDHFSL